MNQSVIPAVLLRALSEYKFVGHPLWRMADGKDHVRVEQESTDATYLQEEGRKQEAACTLCWRMASPAHSC